MGWDGEALVLLDISAFTTCFGSHFFLDHFIWTKFPGISDPLEELERLSPKVLGAEKHHTAISQVLQILNSVLG